MAHKVIPAGYMLVVRSSENDGDFGKTITLDGLSKEEIARYLSVMAKLEAAELTNIYGSSSDQEERLVSTIRSSYSEADWESRAPSWCVHESAVDLCLATDILSELGLYGLADGQFTRRIDEVNVYFNPEQITLKDVGDEFKTDMP